MEPENESSSRPKKKINEQHFITAALATFAGLASFAALLSSLFSQQWATITEPITIEDPAQLGYAIPEVSDYYDSFKLIPKEIYTTTVTFDIGIWFVCPTINSTQIHSMTVRRPCLKIPYNDTPISHIDLRLPSPVPISENVISRIRFCSPFLSGAFAILSVGCFIAIVTLLCFKRVTIFCCAWFSISGLSSAAAIVFFVSVMTDEFNFTQNRSFPPLNLYKYSYSWSLLAAVFSSLGSLLAAFLLAYSYVNFDPREFFVIYKSRSKSTTKNSLQHNNCCNYVADYLAKNHTDRHNSTESEEQYSSVVDLTSYSKNTLQAARSSSPLLNTETPSENDLNEAIFEHRPQQHTQPLRIMDQNINVNASTSNCDHNQKVQYHYKPPDRGTLGHNPIIVADSTCENKGTIPQNDVHKLSRESSASCDSNSPSSSCSSSTITSSQIQPMPSYQMNHGHQKNCQHYQSSSPKLPSSIASTPTDVMAIGCPPPPQSFCSNHDRKPVSSSSSRVVRQSSTSSNGGQIIVSSNSRAFPCEPPRIPELSTFKTDYSKTLPSEARQMTVFGKRGNSPRSATLAKTSKASSEV